MQPMGLFQNNMAIPVKKQLYQSYCRSTLLCGTETIVINKSESLKLKQMEVIDQRHHWNLGEDEEQRGVGSNEADAD